MKLKANKERPNKRFWLLFSLLLATICVRYGLQIDIPRPVFLVLVAIIALQAEQAEIIALCMGLIPLHEALDFYYAIVICLVVYTIKYNRYIKFNFSMILVLVMLLWELLHCFTVSFSPVELVTSFVPLIALVIIMSSDITELDYAFIVRVLAISTAAICITMFLQIIWLSDFNLGATLINLRRLGALSETSKKALLISGAEVQTNSLGILSVIVISGLLQLKFIGKKKRMDNFLIFTALMFGTLSASRTFLACLLLMLLLTMMGQRSGYRKLSFFAIMILAGALFIAVFWKLFPNQLEYFISRFFESDITTGRDTLMVKYHKFIADNPDVLFFGIGLQDYGERLTNVYRVARNVPHNSIQEIVVAWGIPGMLMIILLIFIIIRIPRKHKSHHRLMNYIPLIILLFKSMAGHLLTSGYTMLALSYAYLCLAQDFTRDSANNNKFIMHASAQCPERRGGYVQ